MVFVLASCYAQWFFIIPVVTEEIIQTPPFVAPKTIKTLSRQSKVGTYLLNFFNT